jgi:hypothetical protein
MHFGFDEVAEAIRKLVNAGLATSLPDWEDIRACKLIPLLEKKGVIRPIAIGEVWARVISMCAMEACDNPGAGLGPLHVGVGIKVQHSAWGMQS